MTLHLNLAENAYDITIERGALLRVDELFSLDRRVLVVTDDGVPPAYARAVCDKAKNPFLVVLGAGEKSKSMDSYQLLLSKMLSHGFTRQDAVVAVGGGVVGDLAGFAAATYMRGIDFYNIPTTVLAAVDSSIGGKTAIDFMGVKNIVGAFHQPKAVLIDPNTLTTLSKRHISNGLCEALKMAMTSDATLFSIFESEDIEEKLEEIIIRSVCIKKGIVEADERENGCRRILNFGHTLGHGIEAVSGFSALYHGECVALGMIPMCSAAVRERLIPILKKLHLPTTFSGSLADAIDVASHDKKSVSDGVYTVFVPEIGVCEIRKTSFQEWRDFVITAWGDRE